MKHLHKDALLFYLRTIIGRQHSKTKLSSLYNSEGSCSFRNDQISMVKTCTQIKMLPAPLPSEIRMESCKKRDFKPLSFSLLISSPPHQDSPLVLPARLVFPWSLKLNWQNWWFPQFPSGLRKLEHLSRVHHRFQLCRLMIFLPDQLKWDGIPVVGRKQQWNEFWTVHLFNRPCNMFSNTHPNTRLISQQAAKRRKKE